MGSKLPLKECGIFANGVNTIHDSKQKLQENVFKTMFTGCGEQFSKKVSP